MEGRESEVLFRAYHHHSIFRSWRLAEQKNNEKTLDTLDNLSMTKNQNKNVEVDLKIGIITEIQTYKEYGCEKKKRIENKVTWSIFWTNICHRKWV